MSRWSKRTVLLFFNRMVMVNGAYSEKSVECESTLVLRFDSFCLLVNGQHGLGQHEVTTKEHSQNGGSLQTSKTVLTPQPCSMLVCHIDRLELGVQHALERRLGSVQSVRGQRG
jgi:hypothetical protein